MQRVVSAICLVKGIAHGNPNHHLWMGLPRYIEVQQDYLEVLLGDGIRVALEPFRIDAVYKNVRFRMVRPSMNIQRS